MYRVYSRNIVQSLLGRRVIIEFVSGNKYVGLLSSDSGLTIRSTTPFDGRHYTLYLNTFGSSVSFVRSAIRRIVDPATGRIFTKKVGPTWFGLRKASKVKDDFWKQIKGGE